MSIVDTIRAKMSSEMFAELHGVRSEGGATATVERVQVDRHGFSPNGRYFGACARGERVHRITSTYRDVYVRSRARADEIARFVRGEG